MKKIAVVVQELTEAQRETIRAAAEGHGFEIRFFDTPHAAALVARAQKLTEAGPEHFFEHMDTDLQTAKAMPKRTAEPLPLLSVYPTVRTFSSPRPSIMSRHPSVLPSSISNNSHAL